MRTQALNNTNLYDIQIERIAQSRVAEIDFNNIQFGKYFTDHMFCCEYEEGQWVRPVIIPYRKLELSPSISALHYGQAIFEGMKAYKDQHNMVSIFRPIQHLDRFNKSAARMAMPEIPHDLFLSAMTTLIDLDRSWIPTNNPDDSLYLRPLMFATDEQIGVKPSEKFLFMIFCSPVSTYYSKPIKVMLSDQYVRAFPGGVGYAKAAGNYAATMLPLKEARDAGFDQLLWMDGVEFKFAQEIGTMNIFFVIDNQVITPILDGTILDGITRRSIIELLNDKAYHVQERRIGMDEVVQAYYNGKLEDVFGTGTAATIAHIVEMQYGKELLVLAPVHERKLSNELKTELAEIKIGIRPDKHSWMYKV